MDIIMQIRQRKGKHANGPYWVRVRDGHMGRRKFMMEGGKEQPRASDCDSVTSQRGRGWPSLPLQHSNHLGTKTTWIVRAEKQPDHITQAGNSSYLCQKKKSFSLRSKEKTLKPCGFPSKWMELLKNKNTTMAQGQMFGRERKLK